MKETYFAGESRMRGVWRSSVSPAGSTVADVWTNGRCIFRKAGNVRSGTTIGCNTGSQPCALTLLEGFTLALEKAENPVVGDCWNQAIAYYVEKERLMELVPTSSWYPASVFFQGMKFMLFGDPTLPLPAPND